MPDPNSSSQAVATAPATALKAQPDGIHATLSFQDVLTAEQSYLGTADTQPTAVCISGGGIRSATFALGALQGLADLGILEHFDYLSTVSGGGYIGSWLTAWKQRAKGLSNIIPALESSAPPIPEGKLDPIQHLREYSNYLSPKLGFFSADTWTLVATVARNMLLNWMVFIPILLFALMVPRIVLSLARLGETYNLWYRPWLQQLFLSLEHVIPVLGGIFFAIGVLNGLRYLPGIGHQNHNQQKFLTNCFGPFFLAALALVTTDAWFTGGTDTFESSMTFVPLLLYVVASGAAGYLLFFIWRAIKKYNQKKEHQKQLAAGNTAHELFRWPTVKWGALLIAGLLTSLSTAGGARLLVSQFFRHLPWPVYVTLALPLLFLAFLLAITVFVGFTSRALADDDREWLARAGAWALLFVVSWTSFSALTLLAPTLLFHLHRWADSAFAAAGGMGGILAALAGLSSKTKAQSSNNGNPKDGSTKEKSSTLLDLAGKLAAPVFIVVFLASLAVLTNWILWKVGAVSGDWKAHEVLLENTHAEDAILLGVLFISFSFIMAKFIDINKFSLQAMYRNRLIRAYLGASNEKPDLNDFTGFAGNDNPLLQELDPKLKPFHLVNMTLNLVAGERLAWQQRKAESFTASALHCGYADSYRPANKYGGKGGLSLGTAVAISGAAASPNMGYHSSPAMTFIMTLFNARLGSWLGNPKHYRWQDEGPRSAFDSIIREAFGLTNDTSPYVYLSDGGHFENLALYEMVRRRCRYIVVLDGGADPEYTYEDIGNALRKIRIDMKVSIEFRPAFLEQLTRSQDGLGSDKPRNRCAVAVIRYSEIDPTVQDGYLIYIKPVVLGNEPPDVIAYKIANGDFPNQSTGDQWFDESQTESYRTLGLWSVTDIFEPWGKNGFEALAANASTYLEKAQSARALAAADKRVAIAAAAVGRRKAAAATAGGR